jgi:redox-sensing transcriptional repressor
MYEQMSKAMVLRLARYLRVLEKLHSLGFVKVFSNNLGDAIGVTPAVVRKDFSLIKVQGNKRGGYNIEHLIEELRVVLGKEGPHEVILVGAGRLGSALMQYHQFPKEGIRIRAAFDVDPEKQDASAPIAIYPLDDLEAYAKAAGIKVGIIAVPDEAAANVFDRMMVAGIRGYLNFTSVELKCEGKCYDEECEAECTVHSVNISLELENLFYLVNLKSQQLVSEGRATN